MNQFLEQRTSGVHGTGIYTTRDIKAGEEYYAIPLDNLRDTNFFRYAYLGQKRYVNDEEVLNWVNHSCHPNTKIDLNRPEPYLVAMKDITSGDEITCNYSKTEVDGVKFTCNCGSHKCQEKIGK